MKVKVVVLVILLVCVTALFTINYAFGSVMFKHSSPFIYPEKVNSSDEMSSLANSIVKQLYDLENSSKTYEQILNENNLVKGSEPVTTEGESSSYEEVSVSHNWVKSIPIGSYSLDPEHMACYKPYSGYSYISVTIIWTPIDEPFSLTLYDATTEVNVVSTDSKNGIITMIEGPLDPSHQYEIRLLNCSSKETIFYSGQISFANQ
jgi:hypothetical protein